MTIGPDCAFPGCKEMGVEQHHIIYALSDPRHKACAYNFNHRFPPFVCWARCDITDSFSYDHPEKVVWLCRTHHDKITDLNEHKWRANYYRPLSCEQRMFWWGTFLGGYRVSHRKRDGKKFERWQEADAQ